MDEIAERTVEIGGRLAVAADRHPPYGLDAVQSQRELKAILDEVFGDEFGSAPVDALLRQCAAKAVSRWLEHEGAEDARPQEPVDLDDILVDPLAAVAPDLIEDVGAVELLLDEFHAELLVELVQMIGGEGMFPGLTLVKLLWVLYRWAADRIGRARPGDRGPAQDGRGGPATRREREKAVVDELLDPDMRTTVEAVHEEDRDG